MFVFNAKTMEHLLRMACEIVSLRRAIDSKQISHASGYARIDETIEKLVGSLK